MAGLTSDAALAFVNNLPEVKNLTPELSYDDVSGERDEPVVEKLLSPNALRQCRYRERQKALRNVMLRRLTG